MDLDEMMEVGKMSEKEAVKKRAQILKDLRIEHQTTVDRTQHS